MHALASGLVGATALTAIHETARRLVDDPPRMDVVGMRGLERLYGLARQQPPGPERLFWMTLASDVLANAVYYSAIAAGRRHALWTRAVALGLAAGVGAIALPQPLGLRTPPHHERTRTRVLTLAWYMAGALVTAAVAGRRCPRTRA